MGNIPFKKSALMSIGLELELQLIDPYSFHLTSRAKELIQQIKKSAYTTHIIPEISQSMIEINSSIHHSPKEMFDELLEIKDFLTEESKHLDILICGGGTHPFQEWSLQKIFPGFRYQKLAKKYRYLIKRALVFGQHIHVGCKSAEDALYLTHALARFVPHFIALSASSPFYLGTDTGYVSSRSTVFNGFPFSGISPYLITWEDFSRYFNKLHALGIIQSMKDMYWDIRPKPEFGTVEIRVCDSPLTMTKAILLVAFLQTLSLYLLETKHHDFSPEYYDFYQYNRFQASRFGLDGEFINPTTYERCSIRDDLLETLRQITDYGDKLGNTDALQALTLHNDCDLLRTLAKQNISFPDIVARQCMTWENNNLDFLKTS